MHQLRHYSPTQSANCQHLQHVLQCCSTAFPHQHTQLRCEDRVAHLTTCCSIERSSHTITVTPVRLHHHLTLLTGISHTCSHHMALTLTPHLQLGAATKAQPMTGPTVNTPHISHHHDDSSNDQLSSHTNRLSTVTLLSHISHHGHQLP